MTFEIFCEKFDELDDNIKIHIYRNYLIEHDSDNEFWDFDEEFFNIFFESPMDAVRAAFFGNLKSWNDEYIRLDAYGNIESLSEYDVLEEIEDYLSEIYDDSSLWEEYIEDDDDEESDDD